MSFRVGFRFAVCVLPMLMLGACTSNEDDDLENQPLFGAVRAINALPDIQDVTFQAVFEEFDPSVNTRLFFQVASPQIEFSPRDYVFTFQVTVPGDEDPTVLAEVAATVDALTFYDYVIAGTFDDPQLFVWVQPRRDWFQELLDAVDAGTEVTELVVSFGHAAASAGAVDIYLEPPGTVLADATPAGSIAFGELSVPLTLETNTLQVTVTAPGDPDTVLFTSEEFELLPAATFLFTVVEDGGFTTQSIGVQQYVLDTTAALTDVNAPAAVSVLHAAPEAGSVDVFDNDDFTTALFSGVAFGEISGDAELPSGEVTLAITPQNDVGVVLAETTAELPEGAYRRIFVAGTAGDIQTFVAEDDRRSLRNRGRLRGFNGATRFDLLDLFLLEEDQELETAPTAISNLPFGEASTLATLDPGEYDLILTEVDSTNIVFGPMPLVVEGGEVFEVVITDDAESTNADVTVLQTATD